MSPYPHQPGVITEDAAFITMTIRACAICLTLLIRLFEFKRLSERGKILWESKGYELMKAKTHFPEVYPLTHYYSCTR